jgi:homopolymeric O-antigen transport system ATP-binding protein
VAEVIEVDKLGKRYLVGHRQASKHDSLRDALAEAARGFGRRLLHPLQASTGRPLPGTTGTEEFWALRDVSFSVAQGERIGIIGSNGAGKSTLLKILSRITEPTQGRVRIKGRVASLLEVGTGFHPELSGRENIFLNGAILGMGRAEISGKFDEIVAFAEVEKFLDTPVKRYSSGMYVRLAFAVAAHLEPEILIVDEVLAVGDASFQRKCLGKMKEVGREGRTVLFVSHNLGAVDSLCERVLLLEGGRVKGEGRAQEMIQYYLKPAVKETLPPLAMRRDRRGNGDAKFLDFCASRTADGHDENEFFTGGELYFSLGLETTRSMELFLALQIKDQSGRTIASMNSREGGYVPSVQPGINRFTIFLPWLALLEGVYSVAVGVSNAANSALCDRIEDALTFSVLPNDYFQTGSPFRAYHGVVFLDHVWQDQVCPRHEVLGGKRLNAKNWRVNIPDSDQ